MKTHACWVLISILATYFGYHLGIHHAPTADASIAGQTLAILSRALEEQHKANADFPASLEGFKVSNRTGGDYSAELAPHIIYRRTDHGYIAFVGIHTVAYIEPGKGCAFDSATY